MNTILLLVHDDAGLTSRLRAAVDVAGALDATLLCLDLTIPIASIGADPLFGPMVLEPDTATEAVLAARAELDRSGLRYDWIERRGELAHELAQVAPLADLVVLSSPKDLLFPAMHKAIGETLVHADKPVLAVPGTAAGMQLHGEALLLWDGSQGANDAMLAAMPLLRRAASVTVLEIDDGSLGVPAFKCTEYLSERGIRHHLRHDPAFGEKAGFVIREAIEGIKPAYVVMGGYGHARLVEGLFGGVTERLLNDCPFPLFIKH
ncbi:universal stress protein [Sphingomonas sp. NFR15]|uniref:universal stress protein n=1 Tax=Sphingomonas sp. NFR15 TaxID=1566282 RepID=UPI0008828C55|nr:universal stress protein [Sphingomonas sp. NFR15]SDA16529.1 hypothetical protein SAMN03159340_00930 [Sphingomonas sp. NFR15]